MSQEEVLYILKQNRNKQSTVMELANILNKGVSAISVNLRKLYDDKLIEREELKQTCKHKTRYLFKIKNG